MTEILSLPLDDQAVQALRAGQPVRLNGVLYTARDAAHKRLVEAFARGAAPPIPLARQVIYYVGPAPARPGLPIGPAGPTTSGRMDPYTLPLLERGVKGFIGKGHRSEAIKQALAAHRAVYFAALGGGAALLARHIRRSRIVAYPDLGTEAIRELVVEDFPVMVVNDIHGGDAYEAGRAAWSQEAP